MKQIIYFLENEKNIDSNNIIYINLEIDYLKYDSLDKLNKYINSKIINNDRYYLFIDEVQEIS